MSCKIAQKGMRKRNPVWMAFGMMLWLACEFVTMSCEVFEEFGVMKAMAVGLDRVGCFAVSLQRATRY